MPVVRCTLAAGDWLYLPAGYWHQSEAREESISLSVGVLSPAAMDVFDFLRRSLLDSLVWRQRLPPAGPASTATPEELASRYQAIFADLADDLAHRLRQEDLVRAFLDRPIPPATPPGETGTPP